MGNFKNNEFKVHVLYRIALIISVFLFAFSGLFMVVGIRAEAADDSNELNRSSYIGGVPNKEKYGTYGTNEYYTFYGSETTSAVMTHHGDFEDAKYDNNHRWYRSVKTTSYAGSTYIKYPLAVKYRDKRYDLVIYPWLEGGTGRGGFLYYNDQFEWNEPDKRGFIGYKTPCMYIRNGELRFTMFVCEPPKDAMDSKSDLDSFVGKHVDWTGWFGINDLDGGEYVIIPDAGISELANGFGSELTKVTITQSETKETKYVGRGGNDNDNDPSAWSSRAVYGKFNIPSSGLTIAYGGNNGADWTTNIDFSQFKGTIPDVEYRIHFDGNGGSPVPSDLILVNDSVGSIGATVPDRSGYTFMGWSSDKELQPGDKRLFADDTSAGWDVDQYLAKTGGTLEEYKPADADRTTYMVLNLYAQWEPCVAASVTNTSEVYTGNSITAPNGVTVTKPASGYTIKYRKSGETSYSTTRPSWVNAGSYTVEYQVTAEGYTTKTGSYTFTIDRAPIEVPSGNIVPYNGKEQTGVYAGSGYSLNGNTGTDAGDYIAHATPDSNHKWNSGSDVTGIRDIPWSIARADIYAVSTDQSVDYTGNAIAAPNGVTVKVPELGYTIKYRKSGETAFSTTRPSWVNAGNYIVEYEVTLGNNYNRTTGSYTFTIERAAIGVPQPFNPAYTGKVQTGVPTGPGYTITGNTGMDAGGYIAHATPDSNHKWNYGSDVTGTFDIPWSIDRAPIEVPAAVSLTYNGKAQTGVPAGSGYTITDNTGTDAGNYTAHATPDSNHKWNSGSDVTGKRDIPWSIKKADIEAAAADQSEVYTGSAIAAPNGVTVTKPVTGYTIKYRKIGETAYSATRPSWTNAGSYTVEYEITAGNNYNQKTGSYTFTIDRAPIEVPAAVSLTYNGKAQTGVPAGSGYTITDNTGTDAGNYTAHATPDSNHKWNSGSDVTGKRDIPWSIKRADIEAAAADQSEVYTGSAITAPNGVTVTKPVTGYTVKYRKSGGTEYLAERPSWTDAGSYTVEYEITAGNNYNRNTGSYTFTIERAPIEVPSPVSEVLIYNGEEQTGVPAGSGYTITDNTGTDAGNYVAHATPDINHKWNSGNDVTAVRDIPWSIGKAPGSITPAVSEDRATYPEASVFSFDHTGDGLISAYSDDEEVAVLTLEGNTVTVTPVNTGECNINIVIAEGGNYSASSASVKMIVEPGKIKVNAPDEVGYYTGSDISPDGITVEIPVSGATVRYSNGTMRKTGPVTYTMAAPPVIRDAGTHTVYYTVSAKNYATESGTFEVIINNANISVEVPHRSVVYNGKPQKPDGIKVIDPETGAEVLYGEAPGSYTLDSPPSFTDAGEHMIYYRATAEDYNERTGSYAYEIMRKPVAVPSAIPGLVYDGTEKTGVCEGEGFTLTGNRKTEAGTYKAYASLIKNYIWNDGSTEDKEIEWTIEEEKAPDIPDPGIKVTGVYLNRDYLELTTGVPGIITVRTEPSDAVPEGFTWTVDDSEALSLGTGGLPRTFDRDLSRTVKAQKMGVYTVTVTETGSGLSASCKVRGLAYYDFAKEGYLVTSTAEHEVRKIKGKFYCFDSQGRAEAGFITVNDSAYYFDPDTGVAVKGYQEIKGGRYFFDRKNCVMVRDGMMKFKGKTYHFGTDGKASGGVYYLPDRKDSRAWFYFDENAVMQSGVFRVSLSGNALAGGSYEDPASAVAEDSSGDGLLYFFKKGKLLTPAKDGVFSVNRKKYYVYTDGHVAEGRVTVQSGKGDLIYELDSDGSLLNGTKVNEEGLLYLYKNGVRVKAPKKPAKGGEGVWKTVNRKRYLLKYEDGGLSSNVCFVGNYEDPKAGRLYLKEDGSMAAGELVRVKLGEMQEVMNAGADLPDVEDDDSLWLYYNRKGKLVTREMTKDGWYKVGKQSAYIYEAGNAASGWAVIDGRTYWFDPHTGLTNITVGYVRI